MTRLAELRRLATALGRCAGNGFDPEVLKSLRKRAFTNSMIGSFRTCKRKFRNRYLLQLSTQQTKGALVTGDVAHNLLEALYLGADESSRYVIMSEWARAKVRVTEDRVNNGENSSFLGAEEKYSAIKKVEEDSFDAGKMAHEIVNHYAETQYLLDKDRYEVLWTEVTFNVPFVSRSGDRHPNWRYLGKWDMVVFDKVTGRVLIWDHKTTTFTPRDVIDEYQASSQPVGYLYAGKYLASAACKPRGFEKVTRDHIRNKEGLAAKLVHQTRPDAPFWPSDLPAPDGFVLNVIRKKVPVEPEPLKKGGLSKSRGTDTTPELYMRAINRHGLDPNDYMDVLGALKVKGNRFFARNEINISNETLLEWTESVRAELEDINRCERDQERFTKNPGQCNVFSRCSYHTMCWGDEEEAKKHLYHKPIHSELLG